MLKDPASTYAPGRRGYAWLKLKKALTTLDCVVVGVAVGNETLLAQRHDWDTLRAAMQRLRAALPEVAIATSEPFYFYLNQEPPDFLAAQDFLLPSIHPLYESWFAQAGEEQRPAGAHAANYKRKSAFGQPLQ